MATATPSNAHTCIYMPRHGYVAYPCRYLQIFVVNIKNVLLNFADKNQWIVETAWQYYLHLSQEIAIYHTAEVQANE